MCGTDQKIFAGQFPGTPFPHIPGHEFAGDVAKVGPGVDEVREGDRVGVEVHVGCGRCARCLEGLYQLCLNYGRIDKGHAHIGFSVPGALAEYVAVSVKALHRLPDALSWDEGAFCDNVGIALYAIERGRLVAGERVIIIGGGAFGALAAQVARALSAARVVLLGTRSERLERLRNLADLVTANETSVTHSLVVPTWSSNSRALPRRPARQSSSRGAAGGWSWPVRPGPGASSAASI